MPEVTELYELCGSFVNMEYELSSGARIKLLDDKRIYLGTQLEIPGTERCFGVVADEKYLPVCEYGADGAEHEIVRYQRRQNR